jgi:hypothetical protein
MLRRMKLKGCHFDRTEVKAESQAVLNTLTEHYFQDKVKKKKNYPRNRPWRPIGL